MPSNDALSPENLGYDPDALREKYRQERDRRVNRDGEGQYIPITGKFAHFAQIDPNVIAGFERAPVVEETDVVVIGAGFGGLSMGARLKQAGVNNVRMIDEAGDFGGVWYWNRYPGAQCDVESYIYLPLLEETGYMPVEKYSHQPEIQGHARRIAEQYDLIDSALLQTRVTEMRWLEEERRWLISTNRSDAIRARFVVTAMGPTSWPKLPGIPGIGDFEGHAFHTSRWDYGYTGGHSGGELTRLRDKKVALIGTGATAIQCVPYLAPDVEHLYLVQRTPSTVDVRNNRPTDPEWAKSLKPGWQEERQDNFNDVLSGLPFETDLINDAWTDLFTTLQSTYQLGAGADEDPAAAALKAELADFAKMNQIRARVDEYVEDPAVAEILKPWYRQFCKRPGFNDNYLPTFNRDNVTLVDASHSRGVERITPKGLVVGGVEYPVDCIIFSTGFEFNDIRHRIRFETYGADGGTLLDYWDKGFRTFHGHSTHGFPNLFTMGVTQNSASINYVSSMNIQSVHIAYMIREAMDRGATRIETTAEAEQDWVDTIRRLGVTAYDFLESCTPGYLNNEGKNVDRTFVSEVYAPGPTAFKKLLAEWRAEGTLAGMALS